MAQALQEALRSRRPVPHKCTATGKTNFIGASESFQPSTNDYAQMARKYENFNNNNSTFNGRNLADNSAVTSFQNLKGGKRNEVFIKQKYVNELERIQKQNMPSSDVPYSQHVINMLVDDNEGIFISKQPSGLVEVPRVHEKYEINSMSLDPQYRQNLKTMEMLKNDANGQSVLNFNAGFFGPASALAQKEGEKKDSFASILKEQHTWQNANRIGTVAGGCDLVNYSELHHPLSLHNTITGLGTPLIVASDIQKAQTKLQFVQKGFYSQQSLETLNKYPSQADDFLFRNDPRLVQNNNMFGKSNHVGKANELLLDEIKLNQKERAQRRGIKQIVEPPTFKISPKKNLHQDQNNMSQNSLADRNTTLQSQHQVSKSNGSRMSSSPAAQYSELKPQSLPITSQPIVSLNNENYQKGSTSSPENKKFNDSMMGTSDSPSTQKDMFQIQMNQDTNHNISQQSSPNSSPQPKHGQSISQNEQCRMDMDPRQSKRNVRFGGNGDNEEENDSESPSEMEMSYHELRPMGGESPGSAMDSEYDPRLEQKIEQIKLNLRGGSNSNSQTNTNAGGVGINSNESGSHQRNVTKLEEVLQRQRERLDKIQNQFQLSREEIRQVSPDRTSGLQSDDERLGLSASTNNLEKAYEDLEREIQEIKQKLQSSVGLSSSGGVNNSGLAESQVVNNTRKNNRDSNNMYNSIGQAQNAAQQRMATSYGTSQPLRFSSQSPARTVGGAMQTEGQLDEDDYSLSVSDLNQSAGTNQYRM